MKKRSAMTLTELMAELNSDPVWVEEKRRRDEAHNKQVAINLRNAAPLVEALRAAGAEINSVAALGNTSVPYPNLIPVLMEHLDRPYLPAVRLSIAHALAVREARPYWHELVKRFIAETDPAPNGMKWALHLAVANSADASVLDDLIRLALDRRLGRNRALMVDALVRIGGPLANATLNELESDPDLVSDFARVAKKRRR